MYVMYMECTFTIVYKVYMIASNINDEIKLIYEYNNNYYYKY